MATIEEIKSLLCLDLDNTSGSGIKWIATGKQAGSYYKGYYRLRLQGNQYYTHHIVLLLVDREGILDVRKQKGLSRLLVVDHINDGTYPHNSNHPDNLQIISCRDNLLKGSRSINKGKMHSITLTRYGTYQVNITIPKKTSKTFKQLEDAIKYRDNLITSNSK